MLQIWLVFLLVANTAIAYDANHGELNGTVTDEMGAVIANARVQISWNAPPPELRTANESSPPELVLITDQNGQYRTPLKPGFYDVCTHRLAFSPACSVVRIRAGQTARHIVKLPISAAITAEYADTFHPAAAKKK